MTWNFFEEYCWGSADRRHRFWLMLLDGSAVCLNCHEHRAASAPPAAQPGTDT